jgi:HAD superfamily phosphatase
MHQVRKLDNRIEQKLAIVYVGDTVADMYTVEKARSLDSAHTWIGVGVLPPHVQETAARSDAYSHTLIAAGAAVVLRNVQELTPKQIQELVSSSAQTVF